MNERKQKLLETLDAFVDQRPGMSPAEYGDYKGYRRESYAVTKDMHDYYNIRKQIAWRDSISADDIINAARSAFSGRLTITETSRKSTHNEQGFRIDYCAGQYMPTEYRKAACAVLANAWWQVTRTDCPIDYDPDAPASASPGQWMRDAAKRTFGLGLQRSYFG